MRIPHILLLSSLTVALVAPEAIQAQSIVAADDGGYAGQVIEKVGRGWVPPAGLHGHFSVRIKVTVDKNGKVSSCKPVESSELKAFDDAACGAVYNAAPFGKTPDGNPVDVHMAFRIGAPKKAKREMTFEEAARESAKERERLNNLMASQEADFAATRARERAEEAAKKLGIDMPDIQPKAVDPMGRADDTTVLDKRGKTVNVPPKASTSKGASEDKSGVLIGSSRNSAPKGPELVIKSNLKHLDDTLEAQSMATAEAQAQAEADAVNVVAPPSAGPTQTVSVKERELPGAKETIRTNEAKAPAKIIITSNVPPETEQGLTSDELALPPLITLITAVDETLEKIEQHNRNVEAKNAASTAPATKDTPAPIAVKTPDTKKPDAPVAKDTKAEAKAEGKKDGKIDNKKESKADKQPVVSSVTPAASETPAAVTAPAEKPEKKAKETPAKADNAGRAADKTEKADTAPQKEPAAEQNKTAPADMSYADYLECIKQDIQKKIALPAKLRSERHILSVQLYLSKSGRIRRADLIHSNNITRDTQLAEAVRQVGKVTAPPAALGQHFPLTLVLEAK